MSFRSRLEAARNPLFSSARLKRYGIISCTGPYGMYLLTLNPAFTNPNDNASDIPYSCAKSSLGFSLSIPNSPAFAAANCPDRHKNISIRIH